MRRSSNNQSLHALQKAIYNGAVTDRYCQPGDSGHMLLRKAMSVIEVMEGRYVER
jgi:hypothetical protein